MHETRNCSFVAGSHGSTHGHWRHWVAVRPLSIEVNVLPVLFRLTAPRTRMTFSLIFYALISATRCPSSLPAIRLQRSEIFTRAHLTRRTFIDRVLSCQTHSHLSVGTIGTWLETKYHRTTLKLKTSRANLSAPQTGPSFGEQIRWLSVGTFSLLQFIS